MHVQMITMPKNKAKEALKVYQVGVKERRSTEDQALIRGYRELSRGRNLIDLGDAIKIAGLNDKLEPRLAICRANGREVEFNGSGTGGGTFTMVGASWRASWGRIALPSGTFWNPDAETAGAIVATINGVLRSVKIDYDQQWGWRRQTLKAQVPLVPPLYKPVYELSNYHILWEPEWKAEPARDPILLKHIGGMLYAVLAQWDLTDLERAVLRGRLR